MRCEDLKAGMLIDIRCKNKVEDWTVGYIIRVDSSIIAFVKLQVGNPGQARNLPNLPDFITIILPHFSHGISVTTGSKATFSTDLSASFTIFSNCG